MFLGFLGQVWRLPAMAFKRVLSNPMGLFVYGILSKWYIIVMLGVAVTTFWVFKGLQKSGVLDDAEKVVRGGFLEVQAVAQHCTPLIRDLGKMWKCIEKTKGSDYKETEDARRLREALDRDNERNMRQTEAWGNRTHPENNRNPYEAAVDAEDKQQ